MKFFCKYNITRKTVRSLINKIIKTLSIIAIFNIIFFKITILNVKSNDFIDVSYGLEILENIEKTDISDIQNEIREKERKKFLFENRKNIPYRQRFQDSIVIGDSIAEGLLSYNILSQENIIAKKGLVASKANELVEKAIEKNPENIFMLIGMNDLQYYKGDCEKFINNYSNLVDKIKTKNPNINVYINSILPVNIKAIEKNPYLNMLSEFNESLKIMCQQKEIIYIDNNSIINSNDDIYQNDGIHLKYSFYPLWAENMALYSDI